MWKLLVGFVVGLALASVLGAAQPEPEPEPTPAAAGRPITQTTLVGHEYQIELGPFHWTFRLPKELTVEAIFDRFRGLLGIAAILGVAYLCSVDRRAISLRVLFWGIALQWAFALLV